jgi:1-acyl-sn-glycerol-3-phosphate acyltransferase
VLKSFALLAIWTWFFIAACLIHLIAFTRDPSWRWQSISRLTQRFNRLLSAFLRIRITVDGSRYDLDSRGHLIVSNHLGYVDGIVLGSIFPLLYVTKKEVRSWPLIGQWTALIGTVYVARNQKNKLLLFVDETAQKLNLKVNLLVFPEGTSTNGDRILPFQSPHFAAPLKARAPILPVTLTYKGIDGQALSKSNRDRVYWYGDMDFVSHFWNLLALRSVDVTVQVHPRIDTRYYSNNSSSRKQVSQTCHCIIAGKMEPDEKDRRNISRQVAVIRPSL